MSKTRRVLAGSLAIACTLPQPLLAAGEEDAQEPIIITGTRADRTLDEEPYPVEVIDLEDLQRDLPRTVPEALERLPGVLVQKTASGHGSPYIRGFTGNRTLLVIDGIRYNNATYRDGANEYFAQIDQFTLDRIELVSGPASALYGSEAVGGTLVLTTRPSSMPERSATYAEGEQFLRWSSGDRSVTSRSAVDVGEGGVWGFRGGVTVREYGNIRAANFGPLPYTGYSERAFDGRFDLELAGNWSATLALQSLRQDDVPRTHATLFAVPFAGTVAGTDFRREKDHRRTLAYARLRGDTASRWADTLDLSVSFQGRSEAEDRIRGNGREIDQSFTSGTWGLTAVGTAALGLIDLTYGFDASRENIDSAREDFDPASGARRVRLQGPVGDDADYDQAGAFARADFALSDKWLVEAGLRFSHVAADIGRFADPITGEARAFSGDWSDVSGSLRAQYSGGGHRIWSAYSRSFRAPNLADISRFGASRSVEIEVASLDLQPEKFDSFELAYRYKDKALELGASVHTTALIDYIETVPTGRMRDGLIEVAKQNAASGRITGVELFAHSQLTSALLIDGNLTWLKGRLTAPTPAGPVEQPITRIQPLVANIALGWQSGASWLRAEAQWAARADALSSGDLLDRERIPPGGTPPYSLVGLRGGTRIAEGIEATLALENLLDEAWRPHGSGTNEPGRHLTAGLHLSF